MNTLTANPRQFAAAPCSHFRFTLSVAGGRVVLPGLVCRNTQPGHRPWRVNVFNAAKTRLVFPHLTFDERPELADLVWNLENQIGLWSSRLQPISVKLNANAESIHPESKP